MQHLYIIKPQYMDEGSREKQQKYVKAKMMITVETRQINTICFPKPIYIQDILGEGYSRITCNHIFISE